LAVNDIRAALRYARTYAIANNTEVSLVFGHDPTKATASTSPALTPSTTAQVYSTARSRQWFLRSYCVFSHKENSLITEWKPLPPGVVLDAESTFNPDLFTYNVLKGNKTLVTLPQFIVTDVAGSTNINVPAITFRPDGGLKVNGGQIGTYQVMVTAGSTDGDNPAITTPTVIYKNSSANRSYAGLNVFALTGETQFFEVSPP
jgi:hypothetical protein